ncbi:MAG: NAD(P)-dependent alcohol dehydrogenase [Chloroflexota bacterium]|nr:MAG: NAD(P)-dependent alcohol dehydrogenase [Chloroflexota bacterium]
MKAVVYKEFGPPEVLQLQEVEKPTPKEDEVLIKVYATTVTTGDTNARGFTHVPPGFGPIPRLMFGITGPKIQIIGADLAGEIEAVGNNVSTFKEGDQVYGIDGSNLRAYAEYACRPAEGALALKPDTMSFEEAAAVPFGGCTAMYFLREKGNIQSGQKVLINGASGGVGTYAVQLAKYFGAEVTGVCSTKNVELVESLGADKVIDYTKEDFTNNGQTYDLIFDMVGGKISFSKVRNSLKENGYFLAVAGGAREAIQMIWTSAIGDKKVIFGGGMASERKDYLDFLRELIEAGNLKAVVDRIYSLEEIVEAHRYVDEGGKRGNVAITVAQGD